MSEKTSSPEIYDTDPGETDTMPVVPYRVLYTDIPFYSESECASEVPGARIAILEALDPDDELYELDIMPARKTYQPGQLVSWVLNHKQIWEEGWYRNPENGQVEQAWPMGVEFCGQVISAKAQQEDKDRLEDLETRMKARRDQKSGGPLLN